MPYQTTTWQDRQSEYPNRRTLTPVAGQINVYDIALNEGTISSAGTEFNAANMNSLENRINAMFPVAVENGGTGATSTSEILESLYGVGGIVPISMGGTEARTREQALTNLGLTQTNFDSLASTVRPINIGESASPPELPTFLDNTPQIIAYRLGQIVQISCLVRFATTSNVGTGNMALVGFPALPFNNIEELSGGVLVHEFSTKFDEQPLVHINVSTKFVTVGSLRGIAFTDRTTNLPIELYPETTYNIRFSGSYLIA